MNCDEIRPLLSDYYDGEATPEEARKVESHLVTCEACRHVLAEYRILGGGLRTIPVPAPPAGLRRDVWRAIEAQQTGARPAFGSGPVRDKVTPINKTRQNAPAPQTNVNVKGSGWSRMLPAAGLIAAMLVIFAAAMLTIPRNSVQAASLSDRDKTPDYNVPVHVKFVRPVVASDAINNTTVSRLEGNSAASVDDQVSKSYDPSSQVLEIKPKSGTTWAAGVTYNIYVDAPHISLGTQNSQLDKAPITLTFSTAAFTSTPTSTPTVTFTATATRVPTHTAVPTDTVVVQQPTRPANTPPVVAQTSVPVVAATNTPQRPATATASATNTATYTVVPSNTPAPTNTVPAPTRTSTSTPVNATATATSTASPTHKPVQTATPRATQTGTPKATSTATPRATATGTPLPCGIMPVNGFGKLWHDEQFVRTRLGCPTAAEWAIINAAEQHFQGGYMFWNGDTKTVFAFINGNPGVVYTIADTWQEGDPNPPSVGTPPSGLFQPVRGFGKIWYENPALRQALGWATDQEAGVQAAWQPFAKGNGLWTGDRTIRVMLDQDNSWYSYRDTYSTPTPTTNHPTEQ